MLRKLACTIVLAALAAMALSACGGTDNVTDETAPVRLTAEVNRTDSILDGIGGLNVVPAGDSLGYTVVGTGLDGAKAVYGRVSYDPAVVHLADWGLADGVAGDDQLVLCLDDSEAGIVEFGWVLTDLTNRPGLDGDVELCTLDFAAGPAGLERNASTAVTFGPYNVITLEGEVNEDGEPVLTWMEIIGGDGNNNGLIEVADLTPVGVYYNQASTASSAAADADYDRNGLVTAADITVVGQQWGVSLGGYTILSGPSADSLTELEDFNRSAMFGDSPATGVLYWEWTGDVLTETTVFQVQCYDNAGADGISSENTVSLEPLEPTQTINEIVTVNVPGGLPVDGDGNYVMLISELSVDDVLDNTEDAAVFPELLQLTATVTTVEEPAVQFDTTAVVWYLSEGSGIGYVGNTALGTDKEAKGAFSPVNRGLVTVTAQVPGDFTKTFSVSFVLLSIDSIELVADTTTPAAGTDVQFTATGTFDWDSEINGNEVNQDITSWCNWGALCSPSSVVVSIDTFNAILDTTDASGASIDVSCEFPREENITIFDNARRVSNIVTIDVS